MTTNLRCYTRYGTLVLILKILGKKKARNWLSTCLMKYVEIGIDSQGGQEQAQCVDIVKEV